MVKRTILARALALVTAAAASGGAIAADPAYAYEAVTAQPAARAAVTAGGVRWTCAGTRCTASGRGGNVSVKGCSELARQAGAITTYRSEIRQLDAAGLRECNRVALAAAPKGGAGKAGGPQRAATGELTYTGVWPPGGVAAEGKP